MEQAPYHRSTTRHETWGLTSSSEALAAMVRMLDELDNDGLDLSAGITCSAAYDDQGQPTGERYCTAWVEAAANNVTRSEAP